LLDGALSTVEIASRREQLAAPAGAHGEHPGPIMEGSVAFEGLDQWFCVVGVPRAHNVSIASGRKPPTTSSVPCAGSNCASSGSSNARAAA
jgi:hypothetical protein